MLSTRGFVFEHSVAGCTGGTKGLKTLFCLKIQILRITKLNSALNFGLKLE